jgi:hypothetical protein
LYLDTLDEQRLKKIRDLEAYERPSKAEVEPQAQKPVFITPLNKLVMLQEKRIAMTAVLGVLCEHRIMSVSLKAIITVE